MSTPLNLTLTRGPSVWDKRPTTKWRAIGLATGAVVAGLALHRRANRRWLMGVGLGVAGACLLVNRLRSTGKTGTRQFNILRGFRDDLVDRASEDSFPASDPSSYL